MIKSQASSIPDFKSPIKINPSYALIEDLVLQARLGQPMIPIDIEDIDINHHIE